MLGQPTIRNAIEIALLVLVDLDWTAAMAIA
jgi:hypothetical protein